MNPLRTICLMACLLAATCATPNKQMKSLKPSDWLSATKLESLAAADEITIAQLESMSVEKGAELLQTMYHLAQINNDIEPSFVPSASNIPTYIVKPNGHNVSITLNQLVATAKEQPSFGDEEVTIFVTGLPANSKSIRKATRKLVEAYKKRYSSADKQRNNQQQQSSEQKNKVQQSSEEESSESWSSSKSYSGNLVVIDLGASLNSFKRFAMLDVERTGDLIGKVLVQLTNQADVPQEIIHIVAQGIGAHVAGAAGRQFSRLTGHKMRRITALDPSKIFAKNPKTLNGLARGDAQFVDAIHTSAYGMGIPNRVGDVDFYPNGPCAGVPGADNVVKASMRATRYFAESVVPGNERDFPAVAARSLEEYKNNDGYGKRIYMGIDTAFDVEGDYILQVNSKAPYAKSAPAKKQNTYHSVHQSWRSSRNSAESN